MVDFKTIVEEITLNLNSRIKYGGDLSDIGNCIGVIMGVHIDENREGFGYHDFINGLDHGIALAGDGRHPKIKTDG